MIDVKQSFRRGKTIVTVDVADDGTITKAENVFKSINQAKFANRSLKYRVIKTKVGVK